MFARLDAALPRHAGNPCGSCNLCCTAAGLTQHVVSDLELDYLASRVGPEKVEQFRRYAAREPGAAAVCPYYQDGCTVYAHRPYSCRTFGHYREQRTVLPEVCVFRGHEREFAPEEYFALLPEARAIHQLKRDYLAMRAPGPVSAGGGHPAVSLAHLDPTDPVDRAWMELFRGEYAAAEASAAQGRITAMQQMTLGLARSGQENWEGAREAFQRAVQLAPEAADLRYQLARAELELAAFQAAAQALDEAVRLNPQHAPALTYRGYLELAQGRMEAGIPWLERSLEVDPSQSLARLRLGVALTRLGREDEARPHLERAAAEGVAPS